ncbi:MAG: restriction endonuclease subunit S [Rubrivivax sp.]|nr:restriction endonuclease subunit S [Rubrivivax sp.]
MDGPTRFKMIRTTNVRGGWVDLSSVKYVDEVTFLKWTRRQKPLRGDVILTREAPLGEVGMLRSDDDVFLGQRLVAYRADPRKLDNRFLLYAMLGDDMQGQIRSMGSGATVEHMRVPDCEKLTLRLPPLDVQRRIASMLSAYDDLIENNTRRIAILEEMARRIYEEWFVRFRFPGHEGVRMVASELGLAPEGWRASVLGDILESVRIATRAGDHLSSRRYVPIDCIGRKTLALAEFRPWTEAQSSLVLFEEDDVLFGAMRAYFHKVCVAPFPGVTRTTCFVLRPRKPEFTAFGTMTAFAEPTVDYAAKHAQGATIPYAVWDGSLARMPVLMPPEDLLRRFQSSVSPMLAWVKGALARQNNLRETRDLLLPKLISGELDVSATPGLEALAA